MTKYGAELKRRHGTCRLGHPMTMRHDDDGYRAVCHECGVSTMNGYDNEDDAWAAWAHRRQMGEEV